MIDRSLRFALASALVFAPLAAAHAFLDHAIPGVGSAVHEPPAQLKLWFSERLEPEFSAVEVLDRSGKRVDRAIRRSTVPIACCCGYRCHRSRPAGIVTWRVLSVDTHVATGQFTFDIAP